MGRDLAKKGRAYFENMPGRCTALCKSGGAAESMQGSAREDAAVERRSVLNKLEGGSRRWIWSMKNG